ncbi:all trans-polyprenyl-diphosphate synthase PDSS1 isoform X1 [Patella vulgata]|uniref:all trans-polyprenyl-diphosphate synthase PDSS1 isoform X1 n=2 Tax=Patella vulgata TaxID=6465 RepID=UPI0021801682|nr:all trans-polyprenyl-diphosphate synthase PDSS1 isoform X1 [Patella vulgata]
MAALRSRLNNGLLRFWIYQAVGIENRYVHSVFKDGEIFSKKIYSFKQSSSLIFNQSCGNHITLTSHSYSQTPEHEKKSTDKSHRSPHSLVEKDLSSLTDEIRQEFSTASKELCEVVEYYFDGQGKAFRPMVVLLMSHACNKHINLYNPQIIKSQKRISVIAEMIHTASLVHDDVIDAADTRRGKTSVNLVWGQRKSILAGDFILSVASMALARIRNEQIVTILSQVIEDLVRGEFMQLGSKEDENERFSHYLRKTFKKTASLLANSCKAVAVLANCEEDVTDIAYQYGRNIGIAFQLIDDLLDFTSCDKTLGKPTAADLKLGLATAPVLFAAQQYPQLNSLIMRRFSKSGDVETARHLVAKSEGVEQTKLLAIQHGREAIRQINQLDQSDEQRALINIVNMVLNRSK